MYILLFSPVRKNSHSCFALFYSYNSWDFTISHYKWFTCTNPERFIYYAPYSLNRFHNHKYHEVPLAKWKDFLLFLSSLRIEIQILPWLTFLLILKLCSLGILVVSEKNSFKNNSCHPVPWYLCEKIMKIKMQTFTRNHRKKHLQNSLHKQNHSYSIFMLQQGEKWKAYENKDMLPCRK